MVFATATCPSVRHFFDRLVAPSFRLLIPLAPIPNSKGNPFIGSDKYTGVGKIGDFRRISPFTSDPDFQVMTFCDVEYQEQLKVLRSKLLLHKGMILCLVILTDL